MTCSTTLRSVPYLSAHSGACSCTYTCVVASAQLRPNARPLRFRRDGAGSATAVGATRLDWVVALLLVSATAPSGDSMPRTSAGCRNLHASPYLHQPFFQWQHIMSCLSAAALPGHTTVLDARGGCWRAMLDLAALGGCFCGEDGEGIPMLIMAGFSSTFMCSDTQPVTGSCS